MEDCEPIKILKSFLPGSQPLAEGMVRALAEAGYVIIRANPTRCSLVTISKLPD